MMTIIRLLSSTLGLSLVALLIACSTNESATPSSPTDDTSTDDTGSAKKVDASAKSARKDAGASDSGTPNRCEGECEISMLSIVFGSKKATLDKAYFGLNLSGTLHIEAHGGGKVGCPTSSSAYDHTLIIPEVSRPTLEVDTPLPIVATLLDYKGDLFEDPTAKATSATLTPAFIDSASPAVFVEGVVQATFSAGTLDGHLYATHCDSLDEQP